MKKIKKAVRIFLLVVLVVVVVGTGTAYLMLYMVRESQKGWGATRDEIRRYIQLGDASRVQIEKAFVYYAKGAALAARSAQALSDPLEKAEAEALMREAARRRDTRWEIIEDRHRDRQRFVARRLLRIRERREQAAAENEVADAAVKAVQARIYEELLSAVYIVKPDEVWQAYLKVLAETRPDPEAPLQMAVRAGAVQRTLTKINAQRKQKGQKPVGVHYFGNGDTVEVGLMGDLELKLPDDTTQKTYLAVFRDPPDEFAELDLMRLRYMHRAIRERLEEQVKEFASAMRPIEKLVSTRPGGRVTEAEREQVSRMIHGEILEMLESNRMQAAAEARSVSWRRKLPAGLKLEHRIIWSSVDRLLKRREAMAKILGQLRGTILRPIRKYPEGNLQADLYVNWLKDQEIVSADTQRSQFLWVRRLRPVDIYFNTPDGYQVYSFLLPPMPEKPQGWRTDCAVLLKQEIDTPWLPIGFEAGGRYIEDWLSRMEEEKDKPRG
jgi:hypothetical protein